METYPADLNKILHVTSPPERKTSDTASESTHPYDMLTLGLSPDQIPFTLVKFERMSSCIIDDLFKRVLRAHEVIYPSRLVTAIHLAKYYNTFTRVSLAGEPAIREATSHLINVCSASLSALGLSYEQVREHTNIRANVHIDSLVRGPGGGLLAVEDKSPKVYNKHCNDTTISALCGTGFLTLYIIFFEQCTLLSYRPSPTRLRTTSVVVASNPPATRARRASVAA